jgi:DNA-nicking Smr family endonuclease
LETAIESVEFSISQLKSDGKEIKRDNESLRQEVVDAKKFQERTVQERELLMDGIRRKKEQLARRLKDAEEESEQDVHLSGIERQRANESSKLNRIALRLQSELVKLSNIWMVEKTAVLTHAQKDHIFNEVRARVKRIQDEKATIEKELMYNQNEQSESYITNLQQRWNALDVKLSDARIEAREEIFSRVNSADVHSAGDRYLSIDLHCMYADEAREKLYMLVVPVLPVMKKMLIITGKGSHSEESVGVLRGVVIRFVESVRNREGKRCMEWEAISDNEGALWVHWRDGIVYN